MPKSSKFIFKNNYNLEQIEEKYRSNYLVPQTISLQEIMYARQKILKSKRVFASKRVFHSACLMGAVKISEQVMIFRGEKSDKTRKGYKDCLSEIWYLHLLGTLISNFRYQVT